MFLYILYIIFGLYIFGIPIGQNATSHYFGQNLFNMEVMKHQPYRCYCLLQSDIMDVNQIFKDLGMLVHEQGEVLGTFTHAHICLPSTWLTTLLSLVSSMSAVSMHFRLIITFGIYMYNIRLVFPTK